MKTLKKVVIAPDSFKESLSALGVADAIERGFRQIYPQAHYVKLPMADGGEGTVESMVAATGGEIVQVTVTGPLGEPVQGFYGLFGDGETAVIEMAAASGRTDVGGAGSRREGDRSRHRRQRHQRRRRRNDAGAGR